MPLTDSRGDESFHAFTQHLVALIAEELFRLAVDQDNFSLLVDRDHCVGSDFEEDPKIFPAFLQCFFSPLALGHIGDHAHHPDGLPLLVADNLSFGGDPARNFVGSNDSALEAKMARLKCLLKPMLHK